MGKIQIIEDNKDICAMLAEAIENAGYEVSVADRETAGVQELQTSSYDLLLLDSMLPYKSKDEILRELRLFSEIPVLFISEKNRVGTKIDLLRLGADDYITKPPIGFGRALVVAGSDYNMMAQAISFSLAFIALFATATYFSFRKAELK